MRAAMLFGSLISANFSRFHFYPLRYFLFLVLYEPETRIRYSNKEQVSNRLKLNRV